MDYNTCKQTADKIVLALNEFKCNSDNLLNLKSKKGNDILDITKEVLIKLKEELPLLGIRKQKRKNSFILTNGVIVLCKIEIQLDKQCLRLTLDKNANKVSDNICNDSIINFCIDNKQRKEMIEEIDNKLNQEKSNGYLNIKIKQYGVYELNVLLEQQNYVNNFKEMVKFIVEKSLNYNRIGNENSYLKDINRLLLEEIN